MIHFSLFSGIGGFELAAEWMGWRNLLSCDINEFGNKVRKHYWPDGYCHTDIKTLNYETINNELSDRFGSGWRDDDIIITGGFPCQPYSMAGKRLGKDDERHLWPEMLRVIREVKPTWIVGENVHGLVNWNGGVVFNEVQTDLENEGYEVQAFVLPAAAVNAPHRRDRVWVVAYSDRNGRGCLCGQQSEQSPKTHSQYCDISKNGITSDTKYKRLEGQCSQWQRFAEHRCHKGLFIGSENKFNATNSSSGRLESSIQTRVNDKHERIIQKTGEACKHLLQNGGGLRFKNFPTQSPLCGRNDGISGRLDGITFPKWRNESIKAYGNAVVPQVVYQIFKTIQQYEHTPIK